MEVTKDEQRKLDDLFRKIADRDEFVAQQRQAAETLRRKEAEPPVTVWAVVDRYTLRDWGQEGFAIRGVYLTLDEAVAHIHAERDQHKNEGPLLPISGNGENTRWDYSDWDTAHNYGIEQAPFLSIIKTEGQHDGDGLKKQKTCKTCGFYENNCPFIRGTFKPYPNKVCGDYTYSVLKEQEGQR